MPETTTGWQFIDENGTFRLENPGHTSYLYFPLVNEAGMMAVVTPDLHGDAKAGQHNFLLPPVSVEDLHASRASRNFWVTLEGAGAWSATGNSAAQTAQPEMDNVTLEAGFLWQRIIRRWLVTGLEAQVTSFVPQTPDQVELMRVTLANRSDRDLKLTPTAAIPLYGRSADNLRDHRHVTSLLNRAHCTRHGVILRPTLSFDERGHHPNTVTYAVLGAEGDGTAPVGFYPTVESFAGEGGSLDWPKAVTALGQPYQTDEATADGFESVGALRFAEVTLAPGESRSYVLALAIRTDVSPEDFDEEKWIRAYLTDQQFEALFERNQSYWQEKLAALSVHTGSATFDRWLNWVTIQPSLRRLFGNSFLPYHDYGRGGRGWRDLWQDILALLLLDPGTGENQPGVGDLLYNNFAGVRLDGSNATIIGAGPGEFKADRNNIPRVWMDHGLWPLTTTRLYIDQTGDLAFLLRPQAYFKDSHVYRCQAVDAEWDAGQGTVQRTTADEVFQGTILEHLLIQHLTGFFNVGEHNNIRLEGADWNDGMDMAAQRGESVAFTAYYAGNLRELAVLVRELNRLGITEVELMQELLPLLDSLHDPVDYNAADAKQARLGEYFRSVSGRIGGKKVRLSLADLARDLQTKADWLAQHLRANEWIETSNGYRWYNGYYDNDGQRLEGEHPLGARMTLTGQVFALMADIASDDQAVEIMRAADDLLYDKKVGGYRLNTDFKEVLLNMGRCFGFAYGHKENGAMFSHMAVMYAYALYQRGFTRAGYHALDSLYRQCANFTASRMYPGIPEYFTPDGRGVYPYLTGSASWYLLTLVTQVFGVRGRMGDLVLDPKLVAGQFDEQGYSSILTRFAGREIEVSYHNPSGLDCGQYRIQSVQVNGSAPNRTATHEAIIPRSVIQGVVPGKRVLIQVELG